MTLLASPQQTLQRQSGWSNICNLSFDNCRSAFGAFYARVRRHPALGPIFEAAISSLRQLGMVPRPSRTSVMPRRFALAVSRWTVVEIRTSRAALDQEPMLALLRAGWPLSWTSAGQGSLSEGLAGSKRPGSINPSGLMKVPQPWISRLGSRATASAWIWPGRPGLTAMARIPDRRCRDRRQPYATFANLYPTRSRPDQRADAGGTLVMAIDRAMDQELALLDAFLSNRIASWSNSGARTGRVTRQLQLCAVEMRARQLFTRMSCRDRLIRSARGNTSCADARYWPVSSRPNLCLLHLTLFVPPRRPE